MESNHLVSTIAPSILTRQGGLDSDVTFYLPLTYPTYEEDRALAPHTYAGDTGTITVFPESEGPGRGWYAGAKFGAYITYFSNASVINFDDHVDWDFDSGDFTLDCWFAGTPGKMDTTPGAAFLAQRDANDDQWWWGVKGGQSHPQMILHAQQGGGTEMEILSVEFAMTYYGWNHYAITRESSVWKMYVDGVSLAFDTEDNPTTDMAACADELQIGGLSGSRNNIEGCLAHVRICKGKVLWSSDFEVPIGAYKYLSP